MDKQERVAEYIVEDYSNGVSVTDIASEWSKSTDEVLTILRAYKDSCTVSKTFTDEFKMLIANRDACESVTRSSISKELAINPNTVKKACEKFGNVLKEKAQSDQEFTRIDGNFTEDKCVSCASEKVNKVEENTYYCMECGDEHIFKKVYLDILDGNEPVLIEEYILKVNYEWLD